MNAKETLEYLLQNGKLTQEQARTLCSAIINGQFTNAQLAAVLAVFRIRGVSVEELCGFRSAALELKVEIDLPHTELFDVCGTGGDGKGTFNISTLSAVIVSSCGIKVAKHGNYAVSSKCGSSNVLEALGYVFSSDSSKIEQQIDSCNLSFLHAPHFHPSFKSVAPVRAELGIKTIFNLLGPLLNPLSPKAQLIGVYSLELVRLFRIMGENIDKKFTVVHTLDGSDEISLTSITRVSSPYEDLEISPEQLGFSRVTYADIAEGSDLEESKNIFLSVLNKKASKPQMDVVVANSGVALWSAMRAYGKETSIQDCIKQAREMLESGEAYRNFKKVVELSRN